MGHSRHTMLTVLNVAYPFAPVGQDAVGGAEQVVAQLDFALSRNGHRSLVVASEGSKTAGTLVATPRWDARVVKAATREAAVRWHRAAVTQALGKWRIDLVHLHGVDFMDYLPPPGPQVLVTLHLPIAWYPAAVFQLERPRTYLHCVSRTQHRDCPAGSRLLPPIQNGVEAPLSVRHAKRNFVMCLGRICPEKGFHLALEAASQAGTPLLLAGQVFPYESHQHYFEREIRPRLDRHRRFIGPVGARRKRRLLSAARCLLVPSLAPETSSLVAMEAMACGTPVIAFESGALGEIVEHGRNGFLVSSPAEMADAIHCVAELKSEDCRQTVRSRFSQDQMISSYLGLYGKLKQGEEGGPIPA